MAAAIRISALGVPPLMVTLPGSRALSCVSAFHAAASYKGITRGIAEIPAEVINR